MAGQLNKNQFRLGRRKNASPLSVRSRAIHGSVQSPQFAQTAAAEPVIADQVVTEPADVSAAIGQVFLSKTEARKRRRQERLLIKPYHVETRRPLVCLAFVLPFLVFYEVGSILLGQNSLRSGIDQWLHQILNQFGAGQLVLLPLVTVGIMLAWHHQQHDHWRIRIPVLFGMLGEAIGLGAILFCAANSLNLLSGGESPVAETTLNLSSVWWANAVSYVGSGIYEELIFRILLLVPAIHLVSKYFPLRDHSTAIAVVIVSLVFAALHYNFFNPAGNPFELSSFVFRFAASIVFCFLFLFRGFGIAVGAHVAYDVLTQV